MDLQIEYKISPKGRFSLGLREIWRYRELFYFFTWRDVKVKYKQAVLGIAWAVLQPLLLMVIFTLVFNRGLNIQPSEGLPYPIFAFSGLLVWQIFSGGLSNAANSMLSNANIIKKIYFPRLIIPLSAILTAVVDFFFALIVFLGLVFYYKIPFHPLEWLMLLTLSLFLTFLLDF
jgi:homopolymeric O-antigen transport system permease protein